MLSAFYIQLYGLICYYYCEIPMDDPLANYMQEHFHSKRIIAVSTSLRISTSISHTDVTSLTLLPRPYQANLRLRYEMWRTCTRFSSKLFSSEKPDRIVESNLRQNVANSEPAITWWFRFIWKIIYRAQEIFIIVFPCVNLSVGKTWQQHQSENCVNPHS